jgi:hypothetical protein
MTVLGKLFCILVLILSLVQGAFAVMLYAARTHWSTQYAELAKRYDVERASAKQFQAESEKAKQEKAAAVAEANAANKKLEEELVTQRAENAKLRNEAQQVQLAKNRAEATTNAAQVEVQRVQADVDHLKTTLKKQMDANTELVNKNISLQQQTTAAEIKANALKDRNDQLVKVVEDQARDLARMKSPVASTTGAASRTAKNPPPDNVEGLIRQADAGSGLVKITIGSDAGLQKGQTLEVFRLSSVPEQSRYLGTIRIIEVSNTEAVGQPMGRMAAPLEVGDHVASRIVGG